MKKLFYLFLVLPLIFSSCKKDDDDNTPVIPPTPTVVQGCMDPTATNYVSNATADCLGNTGGVDMSCCTYAAVSGCMDPTASNYNATATADCAGVIGGTDITCCNYNPVIYDISDAVWAVMTQAIDGMNIQDPSVGYLQYFWLDGSYGWEEWDIATSTLIDYEGGPGSGYFTTPGNNVITINDGAGLAGSFDVDPMVDANNMTWRATNTAGEELVITLERTTLSVDDWK